MRVQLFSSSTPFISFPRSPSSGDKKNKQKHASTAHALKLFCRDACPALIHFIFVSIIGPLNFYSVCMYGHIYSKSGINRVRLSIL